LRPSATSALGLKDASKRIAQGGVVERATGRVVGHVPKRMVLPVSAALKARLTSPEYARGVEEAARLIDLEALP
jgi:hypothetical protein